jgi:hypothetical protein
MKPVFHSTRDYHLYGLRTLGWELTVCNTLSTEGSPCRNILAKNGSYGQLLYDFLGRFMPIQDFRHIIEIGGGYGHLMRDFLGMQPGLSATMLDLSPVLLEKQRCTLHEYGAEFIHADFLEIDASLLQRFDLAILNENLGDFPAMLNIGQTFFDSHSVLDGNAALKCVLDFYQRYELDRPAGESFNCNLGAMEAVEKVCRSGIPYIFLSEHSCEAVVPEHLRPFLRIESCGNPEKIGLYGHDEYTLAFTPLQKIAEQLGYRTIRGPLADFIEIAFTERINLVLRSRLSLNDEQEIIRHFIEDLYKYEYLILIKEAGRPPAF